MQKDIYEIIKRLEQGTLDEKDLNDTVIVVDSIEEYMKSRGAVHLNDLDKALDIKH